METGTEYRHDIISCTVWRGYIASCCCMKGLAMGSILSAGHTSTTAVPRHTTRPRRRVSSVNLKGSSGSRKEMM